MRHLQRFFRRHRRANIGRGDGVAECLVERLAEDAPKLVGIDHGFSFPLRYFEVHGLKPDWPTFLDDFQRHWPTDQDIYVDFVRDGAIGNGAARMGNPCWRRLTEAAGAVLDPSFTSTFMDRWRNHAGTLLRGANEPTRDDDPSRSTAR